MSVPFGLDFGNSTSVIGVARNRGIDVIVNEVSNRSTPSLVAFGNKNRFIGETAKSQEISNIKNTVGSLKRIIGTAFGSAEMEVEKKFANTPLINVDGQVGVKVKYLGEQTEFSATQLVAMYLNKIKSTTMTEVKGNVSDIVIAVPAWYSDVQRRAMADAAVIAGLNPVRIVNDTTAAAVGYGVFKTDLPEDKPKVVAFVDVGHSTYTVSIGSFKKGELKILGTATDKNFGGRDFDYAITEHFANIFNDKYKIDIRTNAKAYSRVLAAAEKLKKVLSANTVAPINIESVMEDVDVSSSMKREELEEYVQPLLNRLHVPIEAALKSAGITAAELDTVEVIGGSSRIPSIKDKLAEIFDKPLSFTLNQDEAIARGAAFICAIHSPTLRVRPFKFEDINLHSVTYKWDAIADEDISELEVFPKNGFFPSTKIITLFRSEDFELEAQYTTLEGLPEGTKSFVGRWAVKGVKPLDNGEPIACKLKLRNDPSGFYTIEEAYTSEEVEFQEPIEDNSETKEGEEKEIQYRTVKKWVKRDDLTLVNTHNGLEESILTSYTEKEAQMTVEDKLVKDTEDRKNALEEYIYEIRAKIEEEYSSFASEAEKERLSTMLMNAEDWLYDAGEDASKAQYIAKTEELQSLGNLIRGRYLSKVEEERQAKLAKHEAEQQRKLAEIMAANKAAREAKANKDAMDVE
ncbi:heat shock protein-like protein SSE1 [Nadsonia fulvescens var. elongata DSM 6958]|uniref:Heat shock protein-like protein SSE1 n=1 Tax=Nadsonia fulvescens var. elongata DSM 6958 TaxID=857566 RepID=A0A1E3PKS6_9ASCO|nr:heat shock protein-like protein SSE1 [Nadsonia fulvescens var. elongata DSM 6958]